MRLNPLAGHQDPATAQESHAADPADQEARQQRARRLLDQGEHGAAEALYRQLLAAGCASPSAMINLAALCQLRGALDEADQLLSRALELDPGAPLAWFNRGVVLTLLGDSTAAVACYRRCLELQPGQARAAFNLGLLLHGQGELAAAEQAFRTALALNPHDPETHSNLAGVLLEQGQQPEAIACCRAARFSPIMRAPTATWRRPSCSGAIWRRRSRAAGRRSGCSPRPWRPATPWPMPCWSGARSTRP